MQVPVSVPNWPGPDNYTIIYIDADSDVNCNYTVITASDCEHGICKHTLELSDNSSCSPDANIMVIAFATNMFGRSPQTTAFAGNNDAKHTMSCKFAISLHGS